MKICLVLSNAFSFLQAIQDALRLSLEPWGLDEAVSYAYAEETLHTKQIHMVIIDESSMPSSPEQFLLRNNRLYPETWFITVGDISYPDVDHLDTPLRPQLLTFFMQNQRGQEQSDVQWSQQFLSNVYPILMQHIWSGLLNGWMRSDRTMIMMAARGVNLPNLENMYLLPVLVKTTHHTKSEINDDEAGRDHMYFHELLTKGLLPNANAGAVLDRFSQKWAVLLYVDLFPCSTQEVLDRCKAITETASIDGWKLSFYVGQPVQPENLHAQWAELEVASVSDIGYNARVILTGSSTTHKIAPTPDMRSWRLLLEQGQCSEVFDRVRGYIVPLAQQDLLDAQWLCRFRDDILLELYHALNHHGIPAKEILTGPVMDEDFLHATSGVQMFLGWLKQILDKISDFLITEPLDTIAKKAQKYILQNLDQELTRDDIAAHVFVSGGYLSRVFKKELHMSLSEYIFHERMELAAQMLEQTDQYVTAIALQVGFSNFSYFSTQFKKYSGYSPVEYRRQSIHHANADL